MSEALKTQTILKQQLGEAEAALTDLTDSQLAHYKHEQEILLTKYDCGKRV